MPSLPYPSETESASTIQALVASYLAHNGYVASARGFAKDIDEEERAFKKVNGNITNGSTSPIRGFGRLEEGEEKEVSRRQRIPPLYCSILISRNPSSDIDRRHRSSYLINADVLPYCP